MQTRIDAGLGGRGRSRLRKARENGYLDGRCRNATELSQSYGLWCWCLKIPIVRFERRTPYSRFGRLWLEMLTTGEILSGTGQAELAALFERQGIAAEHVRITSLVAICDRVPRAQLEYLARQVFKTARRIGNHEAGRPKLFVMGQQRSEAAPQLRLVSA